MVSNHKVRCRFRPLVEADLAVFEQAYASRSDTGEYQWFGHSPPGRGLVEMGALGSEGGRLTAVATDDDRVIGSAFWFRRIWGPPETSWCWEIALHIHAVERGRGFGTECIRLLTRYLFDHTLTQRIQAITDVENVAAQQMLGRIGFTGEGKLRAAQWREGRWHDQLIYSLLRHDSVVMPVTEDGHGHAGTG
ncbi:GNAT family N-acetyltransferase [Amycolatopsis eburnea]|uniref:N-acetyltransferase n=1 Tax=Amycolatopsis eburnea TaxID=2267691 RepID=A0A3R9KRP8_9PSEU|nr:GNAT family protein [Amycolatopsis eburnea]RSD24013.1 N-acetyltransferase [Amycolatopsis eburnea]